MNRELLLKGTGWCGRRGVRGLGIWVSALRSRMLWLRLRCGAGLGWGFRHFRLCGLWVFNVLLGFSSLACHRSFTRSPAESNKVSANITVIDCLYDYSTGYQI